MKYPENEVGEYYQSLVLKYVGSLGSENPVGEGGG